MLIMKTPEKLAYQREYRQRTGNACTRRYEKTPTGFLMRMYRNMQSRTLGIQWRKAHLYKGKTLLPRKEFYEWAIVHPEFWKLYNVWVENGYDRKLTPTVNRVNPNLGYSFNNIEWLTHSENSRLGSLSQRRPRLPIHSPILVLR